MRHAFLGTTYTFSLRYFVNENWRVCLDVRYALLWCILLHNYSGSQDAGLSLLNSLTGRSAVPRILVRGVRVNVLSRTNVEPYVSSLSKSGRRAQPIDRLGNCILNVVDRLWRTGWVECGYFCFLIVCDECLRLHWRLCVGGLEDGPRTDLAEEEDWSWGVFNWKKSVTS